jgi:hypothetical protein
MKTIITDIMNSAWWKQAVVIITYCGHRHVRARSMNLKIGDEFDCPFCGE